MTSRQRAIAAGARAAHSQWYFLALAAMGLLVAVFSGCAGTDSPLSVTAAQRALLDLQAVRGLEQAAAGPSTRLDPLQVAALLEGVQLNLLPFMDDSLSVGLLEQAVAERGCYVVQGAAAVLYNRFRVTATEDVAPLLAVHRTGSHGAEAAEFQRESGGLPLATVIIHDGRVFGPEHPLCGWWLEVQSLGGCVTVEDTETGEVAYACKPSPYAEQLIFPPWIPC